MLRDAGQGGVGHLRIRSIHLYKEAENWRATRLVTKLAASKQIHNLCLYFI